MSGSKVDQLPVQTRSPKVEVELTSYYQSQKGHICNLAKYISRLSVMIDRTPCKAGTPCKAEQPL